jgi:acetolactate synthase-1/2/3 large subunit
MYGHEITVAVKEKLPVIFIILNDSCYGAVKHRNHQIGTIPLEFAVIPTDFVMMAKSVGAEGYTLRRPEDFETLDFKAICQRQGPTVLDVYNDADEAPPIDQ